MLEVLLGCSREEGDASGGQSEDQEEEQPGGRSALGTVENFLTGRAAQRENRW